MLEARFEVGDIVTRDGTDEHLVYATTEAGDTIGVICTKEPLGDLDDDGTRGTPWTKIGDTEWNLTRRYSILRRAEYKVVSFFDEKAKKWVTLKEADEIIPECTSMARECHARKGKLCMHVVQCSGRELPAKVKVRLLNA